MNNKFIKTRIFLLAMIVLLFTGCQTYDNFVSTWVTHEAVERSVIRVGVFQPLSGEDKAYGELEKMGIELAHEQYPMALGKDIELVYGDNQSDVFIGETVAQDLVSKGVSVVLGSYGSVNSLVGAPVFEEAKIPSIAITNANPLVTANNEYYSRICFVESFQGVALAKYTVEELMEEEAAVLIPANDDRAQAVTKSFSDKMTQLGGTVSLTVEFPADSEDYETQLKRIKESDLRVCFLPAGIKDSIRIINQADSLGLTTLFLGTGDWETEDLINQAGTASANHIAFSSFFDAAAGTEETKVFMKAFHAKYGKDAVLEQSTVLAYDAYLVARGAIIEAGTSTRGELILDKIMKQHDFQGASGTISFNEIGDPIKTVAIKTIRGKEFTTIFTVVPSWG
jgi:branched-chain amino acid transport system substrate-binding protein